MMLQLNNHGLSIVKVLILLIVLAGLGGGGYYGYTQYFQKEKGPSRTGLPHVTMNEELIRFCFYKLPSLYNRLAAINKELNLIAYEISRLDDLAGEYPDQKKIVKTERVVWEKITKQLSSALTEFEKNIEAAFVASQVNEEKGKEFIDSMREPLATSADEILSASRAETSRINVEVPKTLIEKIREKLNI